MLGFGEGRGVGFETGAAVVGLVVIDKVGTAVGRLVGLAVVGSGDGGATDGGALE